MRTLTSHEEILTSLVHDLRQPVGSLETSLFYLDLVLDHPTGRIGEQLGAMGRQVAQAARLLTRAGEELRALRAQRADDEDTEDAESLPFTKSATAGVT